MFFFRPRHALHARTALSAPAYQAGVARKALQLRPVQAHGEEEVAVIALATERPGVGVALVVAREVRVHLLHYAQVVFAVKACGRRQRAREQELAAPLRLRAAEARVRVAGGGAHGLQHAARVRAAAAAAFGLFSSWPRLKVNSVCQRLKIRI